MSVEIIESTMVYPATETPKTCLWLSRIDMMIRQPYSHSDMIFIYPSSTDIDPNNPPFFEPEIVKRALSETLVPFYPMAGRLKMNEDNGRYEIDCNAEGVLFVEAKTTYKLADFGDFRPSDELHRVTIPTCDFSKGLSSFPLAMVQLTRFDCGGVCLGGSTSHHLADATSSIHLLNLWASIAKGVEFDFRPVHDRATYLAPRKPPRVSFCHLEYEPPLPPVPPKASFSGKNKNKNDTMQSLFKITKEQINNLRRQTIRENNASYKPSTFEILAAQVWRSVCKARELQDDQDVKLYMHVDGRPKLKNPSLPKGYCGNVIFFSSYIAKVRDLIYKPLRYTTDNIHEAIDKVSDSEYLRSAIDYLESQPNLINLVRGPKNMTCPNFQINFLGTIPLHMADFGWGRPKYVGLSTVKNEGHSTIIMNKDGSFTVVIRLFTAHMSLFEKYLYNFDDILSKL